MPVLDAQHFLAVIVVTPALPPQIGRLDRRHHDFDGAGAILLLANDRADLVEHAFAEGKPGVDARRLLTDHARTQHQPVRNDLSLLRRFLEDRKEVSREAHGQVPETEAVDATAEIVVGF